MFGVRAFPTTFVKHWKSTGKEVLLTLNISQTLQNLSLCPPWWILGPPPVTALWLQPRLATRPQRRASPSSLQWASPALTAYRHWKPRSVFCPLSSCLQVCLLMNNLNFSISRRRDFFPRHLCSSTNVFLQLIIQLRLKPQYFLYIFLYIRSCLFIVYQPLFMSFYICCCKHLGSKIFSPAPETKIFCDVFLLQWRRVVLSEQKRKGSSDGHNDKTEKGRKQECHQFMTKKIVCVKVLVRGWKQGSVSHKWAWLAYFLAFQTASLIGPMSGRLKMSALNGVYK